MIFLLFSQCLKITEKVAFNIASEASYVYILSGQILIKSANIGPIYSVFENLKLQSNSVTRQVTFNRTKIGGKCQNLKIKNATFWVIFKHCDFRTLSFCPILSNFWPISMSSWFHPFWYIVSCGWNFQSCWIRKLNFSPFCAKTQYCKMQNQQNQTIS